MYFTGGGRRIKRFQKMLELAKSKKGEGVTQPQPQPQQTEEAPQREKEGEAEIEVDEDSESETETSVDKKNHLGSPENIFTRNIVRCVVCATDNISDPDTQFVVNENKVYCVRHGQNLHYGHTTLLKPSSKIRDKPPVFIFMILFPKK